MRIIGISDTHNQHSRLILPPGDMLIHCGDFTGSGRIVEVAAFTDWFAKQDYKYKIVIPGNHSLCFQNEDRGVCLNIIKNSGAIFLEDSGIEIEGLKIYGGPWTPEFYDWAYNLPRGEDLAEKWAMIPDDTNILITHGGPFNILDDTTNNGHQGCKDLLNRIWELKYLQLHLFGHLHRDGCSVEEINGVKFANCAVLNDAYKFHNKQINIIDI